MATQRQQLPELDRDQFARLIEQESFTREGERAIMDIAKQLIEERITLKEREVMSEEESVGASGSAIRRRLNGIQPVLFDEVFIDDPQQRDPLPRYNLIAEKSGVQQGTKADYTIMVVQHLDSVPCDQDMLTMRYDKHTGRIRGRKAFDMGAAALNSIALAADVTVPLGMRVYFVFTTGEEGPRSDGALALMDAQRWEGWRDVDLVLSSEIGPLIHPPKDDEDDALRLIVGRRGRLKLYQSIKIAEDAAGHASLPTLPNAQDEFDAWMAMNRRYAKRFRRTHPVLGEELLSKGDPVIPPNYSEEKQRRGYSHPPYAGFEVFGQLVTPNTIERALKEQKEVMGRIAKDRDWAMRGIRGKIELLAGATSYDSFCMPYAEGENKAVDAITSMIGRVTGTPAVIDGGHSVADENLYYANMVRRAPNQTFQGTKKGVLSVPIRGNGAHGIREWVDSSDMLRVRELFRMLIEDEQGFKQFVGQK